MLIISETFCMAIIWLTAVWPLQRNASLANCASVRGNEAWPHSASEAAASLRIKIRLQQDSQVLQHISVLPLCHRGFKLGMACAEQRLDVSS